MRDGWTDRAESGGVARMKRTLTLKPETLTELTPADLAAVAGGAPPTYDCETAAFTCIPTKAVREILDRIETVAC